MLKFGGEWKWYHKKDKRDGNRSCVEEKLLKNRLAERGSEWNNKRKEFIEWNRVWTMLKDVL